MNTTFSPASRIIIVMAATIIIIAGMKQAASLLVPFLLSVFIAVLCLPAMYSLQKKGLNEIVALCVVVVGIVIAGLLLFVLVGSSVNDFSKNLPIYQEKISVQWEAFLAILGSYGVTLPDQSIAKDLDPGAAMKMIGSILSGFGNVLANSFLILITVIFILLEAGHFQMKLLKIRGADEPSEFSKGFTSRLRKYMSIKTWMSLLTGFLVFICLWLLGVDHPALWGVLAFLLNFVPNIGSIIAAVPAVLLALVQVGAGTAVAAVFVYIIVNVVVGNVLEPRFMGKKLGLSTLVVFLSLVFWGWVLGPVGMLLSVPLTVTVKLAFDSKDETRWVGTLLGHE